MSRLRATSEKAGRAAPDQFHAVQLTFRRLQLALAYYFGGPLFGGSSFVEGRRRLGADLFAGRFLELRFFPPFDFAFAFVDFFFFALARFTLSPFLLRRVESTPTVPGAHQVD